MVSKYLNKNYDSSDSIILTFNWQLTLNATDSVGHTNSPRSGSIGHVVNFLKACYLANKKAFFLKKFYYWLEEDCNFLLPVANLIGGLL